MKESLHVVKQAIIMAAGKGKRMQPVTLKTPKPLIKLNGTRMIDTIINALHANGIYQIYIVVGYLKDQFAILQQEYDGIELIENPYYETCNNISSLYVAREHLCDCIILDGDQIINNKEVLSSHFKRSGYNAVWCDGYTDEWLMNVDNGIVQSCSREGGSNGWQLFSISRWSEDDGKMLKKKLEQEFEVNKNRQIYWDDVPMFCHQNSFELGILKMNASDVIEIDNYSELVQLDPSYASKQD